MPYFAPQNVPIKCPNCGTEIIVPVFSIIDAKDMPDAVNALIMGMLNVFQCPRCGTAGMLNVPLLYHHPEKKLAFLYVPGGAGVGDERRQRAIGEMTRAVMSTLPDDHPKGYLLQPREFLALPSMLDAIMEAEGIDKQVLEERRRKGELVDKFLAVLDDPVAFAAVVGEHRDKLDAEFYALLRYARDVARAAGQAKEAERLEQLRQRLLPMTEWGRKELAYDKAVAFLRGQPDRKQFLDRLLAAENEQEVEALVRVARPLADYLFFQLLAERIKEAEKAGQDEEVKRLEALRDRVLQITEEVDRETQKAVDAAAELLRRILSAPDLDKAVEENLEHIDDVFLFVLSSQLRQAEAEGLTEIAERLGKVWEAISRRVQPEVPPELAIIEELLSLPYPEGTLQYLESHRERITPEVVELMDVLAQDMERQGLTDAAKRIREVRAQALAVTATPVRS